ncbi:MAG: Fic family protein [Betaproteobacteria bacterium]|nr:Fic family protein [Betaproteobacteria bacterium]
MKPLHGAIPVRFVCIDTLIGMKEASGRLADRADGEELRLTLKVDEPLDLQPGEIDWRLTTWEGSRREQLRCWARLPVENAIAALEEMEELIERFREMRERREFHTVGSGASPANEARVRLERAADEADNESYELEGGDRALACAVAGGASAPPPQPHSPERGREHGLRGGAGGPSDAAGGTRPPNGAMRTVETRFGVIADGELAPHVARNVLELEERIEDGEFATAALDDRLVLEFHRVICGDLVPRLGGWRRVNVTVGEHAPPEFFKVPALVREYGLDLQARMAALTGHADDLMLEALAFAEGRLLSIHPFADFNGRVTRVWLREILRRLDLPPVCLAPVEPASRQVYLSALGAGDRNDWGPLMEVWRGRFEEVFP